MFNQGEKAKEISIQLNIMRSEMDVIRESKIKVSSELMEVLKAKEEAILALDSLKLQTHNQKEELKNIDIELNIKKLEKLETTKFIEKEKENIKIEMDKLVAELGDLQAGTKHKTAQAASATADALKKRIETAQLIKNFKMSSLPPASGGTATDPRRERPLGTSRATSTMAGDDAVQPLPGMGMETIPREATL